MPVRIVKKGQIFAKNEFLADFCRENEIFRFGIKLKFFVVFKFLLQSKKCVVGNRERCSCVMKGKSKWATKVEYWRGGVFS